MSLNNINSFYFIGIGGIGMSALARYFHYLGNYVAGYDQLKTQLTEEMEKEGILITYEYNLFQIPKWVHPNSSLIIYTPALSNNNIYLNFFITRSFIIKKRSEVLGLITKDNFCIAIAGTHGKTTTCALLSHIFFHAGKSCTSFVGGIIKNYNSNIILGNRNIFLIEADEFDRSFLHLNPNIICITSIDNDHFDIYKNINNLIDTYKRFANRLKSKGKLFINKNISFINNNSINYSVFEIADYYSDSLIKENGKFFFNFHSHMKTWKRLPLPMPGKHNLENTTAAIAIAINMEIDIKQIISALESFYGVERRFSIQHQSKNKIYIDDYAHHPTAIESLINTVKDEFDEFNNKKILGIFQPHLFSRTKILANNFIKSLEKLDALILLEIYPSRESPIQGFSSKNLLEKILLNEKEIVEFTDVINKIQTKKFDILLTIGAGNIDLLVNPIKNWLDEKYN